MMSLKNSWVLKETGIVSALQSLPEPFVILVGCAGNKVTDFSQLQSSGQGGKAQAYKSYVELFQRSHGGCSEEKCYLIFGIAH